MRGTTVRQTYAPAGFFVLILLLAETAPIRTELKGTEFAALWHKAQTLFAGPVAETPNAVRLSEDHPQFRLQFFSDENGNLSAVRLRPLKCYPPRPSVEDCGPSRTGNRAELDDRDDYLEKVEKLKPFGKLLASEPFVTDAGVDQTFLELHEKAVLEIFGGFSSMAEKGAPDVPMLDGFTVYYFRSVRGHVESKREYNYPDMRGNAFNPKSASTKNIHHGEWYVVRVASKDYLVTPDAAHALTPGADSTFLAAGPLLPASPYAQ